MEQPNLHEYHAGMGARFGSANQSEVVADYGDILGEHAALYQAAAVFDLSFRSRLCLTGADRVRFLHGQVTNDIKRLNPGEGCYAALVTAKGRLQSDLNIYCLADELLLDFEPGLGKAVAERLNKFIVADDVQVVDVAASYGLLSVQGPRSADVLKQVALFGELPRKPFAFVKNADPTLGETYLANQPRIETEGFDLFVPSPALGGVVDKLTAAAKAVGGRLAGWRALETARIEAGVPRFAADMDETNLPQECAIEARAISYTKGCYIGQEVLNRVHTMGHVNRTLRGLELADDLQQLPQRGDKLLHDGKELGFVTSATRSPRWNKNLALGYVRREMDSPGIQLILVTATGTSTARVSSLPFHY
jgi:folate-binding protein YgfZ